MDEHSKKFVEDYKIATEKEFEIFLAKSNIHYCKKEGFPASALEDCIESVRDMENSFMSDRRKLAAYQLTPHQAISIVSQSSKQDNHTLDLNAIDGSDCYRFMNKAIQTNAEVAHAAWKQDDKVEEHFPTALKERMGEHEPEEVFSTMDRGQTLERSVEILSDMRSIAAGIGMSAPQKRSRSMSFA